MFSTLAPSATGLRRWGGLWFLLVAVASVATSAPKWSDALRQPEAWYSSEEALAAAGIVLKYQSTLGAWPKGLDLFRPPGPDELAFVESGGRANTIDNGATTTPMQFLALVHTAAPQPWLAEALNRGLDYLFVSQYPSGGWPQFYPLRKGYYSNVTYNDNAMVNVLRLLRAVEREEAPWAWVDPERRVRATSAVARGVDFIVRSQVSVDGTLTAWCAQHDAVTLAPAAARAFEPISLSGSESVGLVQFLLGVEDPSPEVVTAIEAAVAWLETVRISGQRVERVRVTETGERVRDQFLVPDPEANNVWARFYELGTNRPIFIGRDTIIRYSIEEIEIERRAGYTYYGNWAARLLERDYPRWRERRAAAQDKS